MKNEDRYIIIYTYYSYNNEGDTRCNQQKEKQQQMTSHSLRLFFFSLLPSVNPEVKFIFRSFDSSMP